MLAQIGQIWLLFNQFKFIRRSMPFEAEKHLPEALYVLLLTTVTPSLLDCLPAALTSHVLLFCYEFRRN